MTEEKKFPIGGLGDRHSRNFDGAGPGLTLRKRE
jgi:hypothetical protein